MLIWDYTATNGMPIGPIAFSTGLTYNKVWVSDSYSTGANGELDNISNTFHRTPGPLPVLGAGAAFGFSRKLRGRIKASRSA